jgi:FKBP-type peptidyl-prolyl cis-trans isomerase FklB
MKRFAIAAALALTIALCLTAQTAPTKADASYALGVLMGADIKDTGIDISFDDYLLGFKAAASGAATRMTPAQAQAVFQAAYQAVQNKAKAQNLAEGRAFLEANRKKAGIKVTPSGLQYEVLAAGSGAKPLATDTVTVNYEGRLLDGTVFDSSYKRNQPTSFPLKNVIKGWTEGLQLMSVGAKYRFFIPSELAYGEQGMGEGIGPNETLVFEVELLSIKK